jgi:hypothetical protein
MDFFFSPLEWDGVLIPAGDKGFDGIDQHFDAGKAGPLQCTASEYGPRTLSRRSFQVAAI